MKYNIFCKGLIASSTLLIFLLAFLSCQNVNEPIDNKTPISLQIRVMDQKRQLLEGSSVEWAIKGRDTTISFSKLRNISTGIFQEVLPVPVIPPGILTYLRILPPVPPISNDFVRSVAILDTFILCDDSVKSYIFFREVLINCTDNCDEVIDLICNLDEKSVDTICSKRYINSSSQTMTVNLPSPLPPEIKVQGFIGSNPIPQLAALLVPPNESYWFCYIYTPPGANIAARTTYYSIITRSIGGQPCTTCNIKINTEAIKLQSCICPNFDQIIFPADSSYYKLCLADGPIQLKIPLNSIRNDNKDCDLIFTSILTNGEKNFKNPNLRITDFNGQIAANSSYIIKPGEVAMNLGILFSPVQLGRFIDTAEYLVQTRNKLGTITYCPQKLSIIFKGNVAQPICQIDSANSTLFKKVGNQFILDTLFQCVGVHDLSRDRTLMIKNIGECDLKTDAPIINHRLFSVTPSFLNIKPGESSSFRLAFIPTTDSVFPNGRTNLPVKVKFNTLATIQCNPNLIELWGIADTSCKYTLQQCMHHWGETQGNWYESIVMNEATNQITYSNDQAVFGFRDIFVENVDVPGGNATLNSDVAQWRVVGQHIPANTNETVCDFAYSYVSNCGSGFSGQLNVNLWDVIVFQLTYKNGNTFCGVAWITSIEYDKSIQGVHQVCMQICYPI